MGCHELFNASSISAYSTPTSIVELTIIVAKSPGHNPSQIPTQLPSAAYPVQLKLACNGRISGWSNDLYSRVTGFDSKDQHPLTLRFARYFPPTLV